MATSYEVPGESSAYDPGNPRFGSVRRALWVLIPGLALAVAALMLIPAALGYHRYVITGDSMSGSIDRGSVVFDEEVPVSELEERDVITYDPPPDAGVEGPITHRIASIHTNRQGARRFRTVGDANEAPDPWTFTLDQPTQARVAFDVPYIGFVFAALSIRLVRILLIGLPALLIAVALAVRLWREAGEELRSLEQAVGTAGAAGAVPVVPADAGMTPEPAASAVPGQAAAAPSAGLALQPVVAEAIVTPQQIQRADAVSAALAADVRRDVERLRLSSDRLQENLVRLRGRL